MKLYMIQKYFKTLFEDKFSVLSNYGNLSVYNYEKMKDILSSWHHRYTGNDNYFDAEWNDKKTRIKIRYCTKTGSFIQIIEEEWITNKILFSRMNNNIG